MGHDENVDLNALVYAVRNLCHVQTAVLEVTPEEIEEIYPFLGWHPPEIAKETMQRTTGMGKLENRLPLSGI